MKPDMIMQEQLNAFAEHTRRAVAGDAVIILALGTQPENRREVTAISMAPSGRANPALMAQMVGSLVHAANALLQQHSAGRMRLTIQEKDGGPPRELRDAELTGFEGAGRG